MLPLATSITVHFIGVGGIGMSGLAELLVISGWKVSGSDIADSSTVQRLSSLGVKIFLGHQASNVDNVHIVVYSSAISASNVELQEARIRGIPIFKRAQMLAHIMRLKYGITVAGTHGKTTTTSFLATILEANDFEPTYIIGGKVKNLSGNVAVGSGKYLVAEADESDGSFLELSPCMMILTNIDNDHLNYYGSFDALLDSFVKFINRLPFFGLCSLNIEDKVLASFVKTVQRRMVTFGLSDRADYFASDIVYAQGMTTFKVHHQQDSADVKIFFMGEHNVLNALGAISIAHQLDVDLGKAAAALAGCRDIAKRQQLLFRRDNCLIISDYAHHPTAIRATINAIVKAYPGYKIKVIFEPHRFSRTRACWQEFLHAFNQADSLYLMPIYSASEDPIIGISSNLLVEDINKLHPQLAQPFTNLKDLLEDNSIILAMGAGSIDRQVRSWIKQIAS